MSTSSAESCQVQIDVKLAVDLAYHVLHNADDEAEAVALHDSLVRSINNSGAWHVQLSEVGDA